MSEPTPLPSLQSSGAHPVLPAWVRFLLAAGAAYGAGRLAGILAVLVTGNHLLRADLFFRFFTLVILLAVFSFFLRVLDENERSLPEALTLPLRRSSSRQFLLGLSLGGGLMSLEFSGEAIGATLSAQVALNRGSLLRLLAIAVLLIAGALMEELSFRGYPFQRLVESVGPIPAVAVLSILFGWVHLSNPESGGLVSWSFCNTIAVGILLAVLFLRSRTLWMPLGFHFGWNFFQGCVFGLPVSGITYLSPVVRTQAVGPVWLTGGAYGPEASALCTALTLAALGLVICVPERIFKAEERR